MKHRTNILSLNMKSVCHKSWLLILQILYFFYMSGCTSTDSVEYIVVSSANDVLSMKSCIFPPDIELELNFRNGTLLTLNLVTSDNQANRPLYVIRRNVNGVYLQKQTLQSIQDVALYQDVHHGASIELKCIITETKIVTARVSGTYNRNGLEYFLYKPSPLDLPATAAGSGHTNVYAVKQKTLDPDIAHDYRPLPKGDKDSRRIKEVLPIHLQPPRTKRASVILKKPYVVDLLLVIDYQIYSSWYRKTAGANHTEIDKNTKNEIRKYFSHFVNEIDLRYKTIDSLDLLFKMNIAGFVVADTAESYPALELRKEVGNPRDYVNANYALNDFRTWIRTSHQLPLHDHAMLFTGLDLYSFDDTRMFKLLHTAGLAFIGSMCRTNGDSISVIEDRGGFQNTGTASHELGHSLGAVHDGESNSCNSSDRYIMAASGYGTIPPELRVNQWRFSNCTPSYFREFIANITKEGYTCLTESRQDVSEATDTMLGQLYSLDEQCKLIWGPNSYLCRGSEFGNASTVCSSMYCRDPRTESDCVLHFAARGSSCGNKKWCLDGVCTYDQKAPERSDHCLLGDQPGIAFNNQTCEQLVNSATAFCYNDRVTARCCESCYKHYTWRKGCEFGDRAKNCQTWFCDHSEMTLRYNCCATCNIGELITTTTPAPYTIRTYPPEVSPVPGSCDDTASINGKTCNESVTENGRHLCYDDAIEKYCCYTCSRKKDTKIADCSYGDRKPSTCSRQVTLSWCQTHGSDCCKTCAAILTATASPLTWSFVVYMIIAVVHIIL